MVDPQQQQGYPYPFRDQCIAVSLMIVRFYRGVSVQPVSLPATYDKQVSYKSSHWNTALKSSSPTPSYWRCFFFTDAVIVVFIVDFFPVKPLNGSRAPRYVLV